jgi:hypothetical protein
VNEARGVHFPNEFGASQKRRYIFPSPNGADVEMRPRQFEMFIFR